MSDTQPNMEILQAVMKAAFALAARAQEGQPSSTPQPPEAAGEPSLATEEPTVPLPGKRLCTSMLH